MRLSEILSKSLDETRGNLGTNFSLLAVFYIIPYIVVFGILAFMFFSLGLQDDLVGLSAIQNGGTVAADQISDEVISVLLPKIFALIGTGFVLFVLVWFIMIFGLLAIYALSLKKSKFSFSEAVSEAKKHYWRTVGLNIVIGLLFLIATLVLYIIILIVAVGFIGVADVNGGIESNLAGAVIGILLVVLIGIVGFISIAGLLVYFVLSPFVLVKENKGVFASLSDSVKLVKGRWKKVFGYSIVVFLIYIAFYILVSILSSIIQVVIVGTGPIEAFSMGYLISLGISTVFQIIIFVLIMPFVLLFFKNFYLDIKKKK